MFVIKDFSNYQKSIEENINIFVHLPIFLFSSLEVTTINGLLYLSRPFL